MGAISSIPFWIRFLERSSILSSDKIISVFDEYYFSRMYNLNSRLMKRYSYIPNGISSIDIHEYNTNKNIIDNKEFVDYDLQIV